MSSFEIRVQPYMDSVFKKIPTPSWLSFLLFWLIVFAVDRWLASVAPGGFMTELGIILFFCSVCISLSYSARVLVKLFPDLLLFLDQDSSSVQAWYTNRLSNLYRGWGPILSGLTLAMAVEFSVGQTINTFQVDNPSLLIFRMIYRIIGFFVLGMSLWSLLNVMRLPGQLLAFEKKGRLTHLASLGLHALGTAFFKLALATISCYIVLVGTISVSPLSNNFMVLVWASLGSLIIFCFFLLPQLGIHKIMAKEKRQQLISFSSHLDEALTKSLQEPTIENTQKLKELFELQKHLREINDWPFDTQTLWQLISALLIPLLLVIVQLFLDVKL
jgi:hypothetical protein